MVNQYSSEDNQAIETPVRPRPCLWQGTAENRWWTSILSRITRPSRPPVHPRPCLWQGTAENRWGTGVKQAIETPVRPRPRLRQGQPRTAGGSMHGDLRTRPLPYIYFTSTKPPFDFCSYNTQVNGKFSLKFQSQGLQRDSRSPFARVSRMGQPRIDGGPVLFRGKPVQRDSGSPSALSLAEDNRESMVDQYSSEDNQATGTPVTTSAVSLAGDGRVPMVEQCYPGDKKNPPGLQSRPRPCLRQGTTENRWWLNARGPSNETPPLHILHEHETPLPFSPLQHASQWEIFLENRMSRHPTGLRASLRPCLWQGKADHRWWNNVLPRITSPPGLRVPLRPCLWQGTAGYRWWNNVLSPVHRDSGSPFGRVSGRGQPSIDGGTMFYRG